MVRQLATADSVMNESTSVPDLIVQLASDRYSLRQAAEQTLFEMGSTVVTALLEVIAASGAESRWQAAALIARIDDPRCTAAMKEWLVGPDPVLGDTAANRLAAQGEAALLAESLPMCHIIVQLRIAALLEEVGTKSAVAPLIEVLQATRSSTLRHTIIQTLGVLGDPAAVPFIEPFVDDADHHVRKRTRIALERLRNQPEIQAPAANPE
jgi:HEAT repeat protein